MLPFQRTGKWDKWEFKRQEVSRVGGGGVGIKHDVIWKIANQSINEVAFQRGRRQPEKEPACRGAGPGGKHRISWQSGVLAKGSGGV